MWDSRKLMMLDHWIGLFSVSALVRDVQIIKEWIISSIYGPTISAVRGNLWRELDLIRSKWSGPWCLGGDFNVIRCSETRVGGCRVSSDMNTFSEWINSHVLHDLKHHRAKFTWSNHRENSIMSRLDRFLISMDWIALYQDVLQKALLKPASDHCPILLDSRKDWWGPALFRFELMWLEES